MLEFLLPARGAGQAAWSGGVSTSCPHHLLFPGFSFPTLFVLYSTAGWSGSRCPSRGRGQPGARSHCAPGRCLSGEITVKSVTGNRLGGWGWGEPVIV